MLQQMATQKNKTKQPLGPLSEALSQIKNFKQKCKIFIPQLTHITLMVENRKQTGNQDNKSTSHNKIEIIYNGNN